MALEVGGEYKINNYGKSFDDFPIIQKDQDKKAYSKNLNHGEPI